MPILLPVEDLGGVVGHRGLFVLSLFGNVQFLNVPHPVPNSFGIGIEVPGDKRKLEIYVEKSKFRRKFRRKRKFRNLVSLLNLILLESVKFLLEDLLFLQKLNQLIMIYQSPLYRCHSPSKKCVLSPRMSRLTKQSLYLLVLYLRWHRNLVFLRLILQYRK